MKNTNRIIMRKKDISDSQQSKKALRFKVKIKDRDVDNIDQYRKNYSIGNTVASDRIDNNQSAYAVRHDLRKCY